MKHILIVFITAISILACQQEDPIVYTDANRLEMKDTAIGTFSFFYEPESTKEAIIYIDVRTIGRITNYDRKVRMKQIPEYDITYNYDENGNVTDTIKTEKENKAVSGLNYKPLDDPSVENEFIIKANQNSGRIPITVLRNESLKEYNELRLRLEIINSDDFEVGQKNAISKTIIFSEGLLRPTFWGTYFTYFGTYGKVKHQFMIEVSEERIDDEWYNSKVNNVTGAIGHYQNFFRDALIKFNNNPENIANGSAPLREDPSNLNNIITF